MPNPGATRAPVSHQTVKLARGNHASPADGVCVMELASMLAGEEFSDHPQSVCPVIGAFLRAYNDCVDDHWRQDLYAYAAKVVGTRSTIAVERQRAAICREWGQRVGPRGGEREETSGWLRPPGALRRWLQSARREFAGRTAGMIFGQAEVDCGGGVLRPDRERHRAALQLLDELIAVGAADEMGPVHPPVIDSKESVGAEGGSSTLSSDL
jgi:hypothetical protein